MQQEADLERKEGKAPAFPENSFDQLSALEFFLFCPGKLSEDGRRIYFSFDSSETVSFLRPFLRRLASTLRPLAVCIRSRKP
jgi:hypothetical protein